MVNKHIDMFIEHFERMYYWKACIESLTVIERIGHEYPNNFDKYFIEALHRLKDSLKHD